MNALKEALARKRTGEISPTQEPDLESAPAVAGSGAEEQDPELDGVVEALKASPELLELVKNLLADKPEQGEEDTGDGEMDEALTDGMTNYDKESLAANEAPASLGGKARKAALDRLKNKA